MHQEVALVTALAIYAGSAPFPHSIKKILRDFVSLIVFHQIFL